MKVLHIVAGELSGGAARGAYWLHLGLLKLKVDSAIICNATDVNGYSKVEYVTPFFVNKAFQKLRSFFEKLLKIPYPKKNREIFSTGFFGVDITKLDAYINADIIHLHWINNNFLKIKSLSQIKKPIVWTMRDMWPMTGGCHYTMGCNGYESTCGFCPQLKSKRQKDLSFSVLQNKIKHYPKKIKLVGVSNWIRESAIKSRLFKNSQDIEVIPNGIDTDIFFPISKLESRSKLNLDSKSNLILVASQDLNNFYKGFSLLLEAIKYVKKDFHILFLGKLDENLARDFEFTFTSFGFIDDVDKLRLIYSAADVFVAPSIMDAFPKAPVESMACGTPVVCFDATGLKDLMDHKEQGYKATPFNALDLAAGIEWVFDNAVKLSLSEKSRRRAVAYFDTRVIAKKYFDIYQKLLNPR
jgi:glycosyltransferase involved in cell wall biosynthesis